MDYAHSWSRSLVDYAHNCQDYAHTQAVLIVEERSLFLASSDILLSQLVMRPEAVLSAPQPDDFPKVGYTTFGAIELWL